MHRSGLGLRLSRFAFFLGTAGLAVAAILVFGIQYFSVHLEVEGVQLSHRIHRRDQVAIPGDDEVSPAPETRPNATPDADASAAPSPAPAPVKAAPPAELPTAQAVRTAAARTFDTLKPVLWYVLATGAIWVIDVALGPQSRRRR